MRTVEFVQKAARRGASFSRDGSHRSGGEGPLAAERAVPFAAGGGDGRPGGVDGGPPRTGPGGGPAVRVVRVGWSILRKTYWSTN